MSTLSEIATLAAKKGIKATKPICFDIVKNKIINDEPLTDAEKAKLYAFFTPATPAKKKDVFSWVFSATNKKDVREYLQYAYVTEDKKLVATDGHRLHIVENYVELEPGYYDKNKVKINEEWRYPDIDRVIPRDNSITINPEHYEVMTYTNNGKTLEAYDFGYKNDLRPAVHKPYFDAAITSIVNVDITCKSANESILIEGQMQRYKVQAVIMPIKKDK